MKTKVHHTFESPGQSLVTIHWQNCKQNSDDGSWCQSSRGNIK